MMGIWMAKVPCDHVSRNRNVFVLVLSRGVELDILRIMYLLHVCKNEKIVYVDYLKCDIYVNVRRNFGIWFSVCWMSVS